MRGFDGLDLRPLDARVMLPALGNLLPGEIEKEAESSVDRL